jgi:abortive infection bacteriophage resistance protein
MRDNKKIDIQGGTQKKKLRYIGYFHGYKGYKYFNSPNDLLKYSSFNELQAVYDFDMKLKTLLYPQIMFLETALKNYVLESILKFSNSANFVDVYTNVMNDYKSYRVGSADYKKSITKRMGTRNKIYSVIARDYGKNNIVSHYYDKDQPVPIWAIFEMLSLGEFGNLVNCLNQQVRKDISKSVGINPVFDTNSSKVEKIIFVLKDLRNSVAHNNTIFDTRFKTRNIDKSIAGYITSETGVTDINFNTILDYIILIAFMMSLLKCNKSDILHFIKQFEDICEVLRKSVPMNIYSKIVYTNTRGKLSTLKNYL